MVDHIVEASEPRGRVEIQVGAGRRRRWSDEVKGRIVAESYVPGAVVSEVARRHGISPQHLFVWRRAARAGVSSLPADEAPSSFQWSRSCMALGRARKRQHGVRQRSASRLAVWWFARRSGSIQYGCAMCCGPNR